MDCTLQSEPSAPGESTLSHAGHSSDRAVTSVVPRRGVRAKLLADPGCPVRDGMALSVRRPRSRGQAARVLSRLALPFCGIAMVAGQDARARLAVLTASLVLIR